MSKMLKNVKNAAKNIFKNNILVFTFFITSLVNEFLVRFFTVQNNFAIKPLLADSVVILLVSAFGYFIKPKHQFKYFCFWGILFTLLCMINTIYYGNYISFSSISLFKTAGELGGYTDAVFENILELKDFIFLFQIFTLVFVHLQLKRSKYYEKLEAKIIAKSCFLNTCAIALIITGIFISMLTSTDISRLNKQWNRSSIVMEFGMYFYQINDVFTSLKVQVNEMFGYDDAYKTFRDYYENREVNNSSNMYTNIFKGKNVLVIHGESIQGFTMNLKFNDEELTPNLNRIASEGIYFSNYYSQESVGNSSDTEFTSLTSLLPSSSGTVFVNYFNRDYETILKLLKDKNYYTFSMHANNGSAWNRLVTYKYLGYDDFYYYSKDYEIDEIIGLGLSDKSFFRQSVEKIKNIHETYSNFYDTLVMLTNHTPFSDVESFNYLVDIVNVDEEGNEEIIPWLEGTKVGNYLKSVNYADSAIGELFELLDEEGILDDTIVVIYGDHDAKLKKSEMNKLYKSEYYESSLIDVSQKMENLDEFTYEINRKVPLIIWSKDIVGTKYNQKIDEVMGMVDMMPTLSNMLGVTPKYALGHDIFSIEDNVVVFPSGNWMTNKLYYNSSKNTFRQLELDATIDMDYIDKYNDYAEELIKISNGIITYNLIKAYETGEETLIQQVQ